VAVEGVAAELAVGDDVQPGGLLAGDREIDCRVLDLLQLGVANRSRFVRLAGGDQRRWPKQAADDVRVGDQLA